MPFRRKRVIGARKPWNPEAKSEAFRPRGDLHGIMAHNIARSHVLAVEARVGIIVGLDGRAPQRDSGIDATGLRVRKEVISFSQFF
jgi:hypothetical protein